ncbi:hypothetical protein MGYG_08997 [Nannizzia gypsea CBS 118893]|uniref:Uncharacterized protein n=1 Tax=Arthroderma gypseum (strain ATCC MYA-4604 / CBS 118893) TaxID=535722 RepID=E4UP03_ARTGP|nr:hypothetical protein MGYG_08997 [Nannizzia gypsea CBS 118893]EFQ99756.1 hypothetical protein MGYG_08997 [Nannizzia gypsea CBS 118893]
MSPVSTDGSEWSGINQYSLPSPNSVRGFPTPPQSGPVAPSHNGPSDTTKNVAEGVASKFRYLSVQSE